MESVTPMECLVHKTSAVPNSIISIFNEYLLNKTHLSIEIPTIKILIEFYQYKQSAIYFDKQGNSFWITTENAFIEYFINQEWIYQIALLYKNKGWNVEIKSAGLELTVPGLKNIVFTTPV